MNKLVIKYQSRLDHRLEDMMQTVISDNPTHMFNGPDFLKKLDSNILSVKLKDNLDLHVEFTSVAHKNWFVLRWSS